MSGKLEKIVNFSELLEKLHIYKGEDNFLQEQNHKENIKAFILYESSPKDKEIEKEFQKIEQAISLYQSDREKNFKILENSFIAAYRLLSGGGKEEADYSLISYHLPAFCNLFAKAFKGYGVSFSEVEEDFLLKMLSALANLTGCILKYHLTKRLMDVQFQTVQDNFGIAHIHDNFHGSKLTLPIPYDDKSFKQILQIETLLRRVMVEECYQTLPLLYLDDAFSHYKLYFPLKFHKEGVINPQLDADLEPSLLAMVLPEIQEKYFKKELLAFNNGSVICASDQEKYLDSTASVEGASELDEIAISRDDIEKICDGVVNVSISLGLTAYLGPVGTILAPIAYAGIDKLIGELFDSMFGAKIPPVTMDQVDKEIRDYIRAAEGEVWAETVRAHMHSFGSAILQRADSLKNYNQGETDLSKWKLDAPENWESIINIANLTKEFFFSNTFEYHYQCSSFFPVFLTQYSRILTARIRAKEMHGIQDYSYEVECLRDFYTRSAIFLKTALEQAWNKSVSENDFYVANTVILLNLWPFLYYGVVDGYNGGAYPKIPAMLGVYPIDDNEARGAKLGITFNDLSADKFLGARLLAETRLRFMTVHTMPLWTASFCLSELCDNFNKYFAKGEKPLPSNYHQLYVEDRFIKAYKETSTYAWEKYTPVEDITGLIYAYDHKEKTLENIFNGQPYNIGDYAYVDFDMPAEPIIISMASVEFYSEVGFKGRSLLFSPTDDKIEPERMFRVKSMRIKMLTNKGYNSWNDYVPYAYSRLRFSDKMDEPVGFTDFKTLNHIKDPFYVIKESAG